MTRIEMCDLIDAKAGWVRSFYLTIAPGQESTYYLKAEQAKEYTARLYIGDVPVMVQAEADATGVTPQQAAQSLMSILATWASIAANIEYVRIKAKLDIVNAASDEAAETIFRAALESLIAIAPV